MRSSTSSSERRWLMPLAGGTVIALLVFALLETVVRLLGYEPGVRDGPVLWGEMRTRADNPGTLVLVGGSRMLLDVDVQRLSALTGRPVVQLAVDGQSFQPVLQDLSNDPDFQGTVLVDVLDQNLTMTGNSARAQEWVDHWHKHAKGQWSARTDAWLAGQLQTASAWYAAEPPWQEMFLRIVAGARASNYLVTLPDRGRRADYGPRDMQAQMYVNRVLRDYIYPVDLHDVHTLGDFEKRMGARIEAEQALEVADFPAETANARAQVEHIRARGGQVVFLRMPSRGLVRRIEEIRFPRARYWDRFVAGTGAASLHFTDDPALAAYQPPDGSHLDGRDVRRYTDDLYAALHARHLL